MKKLMNICIILFGLSSLSQGDVVICKGVAMIESTNGVIGKQFDISQLSMQLNTTKEKAVMIFNKRIFNFNFVKEIQHPGGFMMDAYNDGVSEEILYSKENKVATLKSYTKTKESIMTFQCKDKEYSKE